MKVDRVVVCETRHKAGNGNSKGWTQGLNHCWWVPTSLACIGDGPGMGEGELWLQARAFTVFPSHSSRTSKASAFPLSTVTIPERNVKCDNSWSEPSLRYSNKSIHLSSETTTTRHLERSLRIFHTEGYELPRQLHHPFFSRHRSAAPPSRCRRHRGETCGITCCSKSQPKSPTEWGGSTVS